MTAEAQKEKPPRTPAPQQLSAAYDGTSAVGPVLEELGIPREMPVLVVVGWAASDIEDDTRDALDLFLRRVVAPVCRDEGVVVVSGGTDAGVMAALGQAVAEHAPDVILVGVAPDAKLKGQGADASDAEAASPEPEHRMIRTPGDEWGDEGLVLIRVAETIAGQRGIAVLAIGGGEGTDREIALAVRRRWPVILMTGHGGASDAVASLLKLRPLGSAAQKGRGAQTAVGAAADTTAPRTLGDRQTQELLLAHEAGCIAAISLGERDVGERALRWRLSQDDVLRDAWTRFATTDSLATFRKKPTAVMAGTVLTLASLTVICAVGAASLQAPPDWAKAWASNGQDVLKGVVTALPLVAAALLGLIERRSRRGSWIDLRAAAEAVIREIYQSRALAPAADSPEEGGRRLGSALAEIDLRTGGWALVQRTPPMSHASMWPPETLWRRVPTCDSLLGPLTALSYDQARVLDQLFHYEKAARAFDRQATRLAAAVFGLAGGAAFFLALSWRWQPLNALVAILGSLAAALISWREYRQRDARAEAMLAACVGVRSARGRWLAAPGAERETPESLASYVRDVEMAMASEGSDWQRSLRQAHQVFAERR